MDMLNIWFGRMLRDKPQDVLDFGEHLVSVATDALETAWG